MKKLLIVIVLLVLFTVIACNTSPTVSGLVLLVGWVLAAKRYGGAAL